METLKSEKKRVLPSWMTAPVDERKVVPVKTHKKRVAAVHRRPATRAPTTETVHWMSEAEMVSVALEVLIEDGKQEKLWEQPSLVATDKPQLSPPYSASPHTSSPGSSSEEEDSGNDSPLLGLSPSRVPAASDSPCSRSPKEEKEEEDALKYVREIFFS
ncbi:cell cycle regulator of non-homologous end joining [Meriones unguiculatus]|uniref:cell cycle regulator of non-homologous end joining n=1 Tax=Meriones unguiculatus TaxID=10047 RepID=UPI000B4F3AA1|nr:modulator of retrovirus infection homolog [Meriones unguiculatus]XP_021504443.1 cell cycle regulator of non-homologous end joining [Meriones unguiculatus]